MIGSCKVKETNQSTAVASEQWLCSPPYLAKMGGASVYIVHCLSPHLRFLLFSDEDPSSLTLRWRRDLPLKHLSSRIGTSCSHQLADSVIPCGYLVKSKKVLLEEQISAQRCCKCRAVIVRRAGIPCTLMTLTLSVCHAWGNPTLTLRSAGLIACTASVSVLPLCARG